MDPDAEVSVQDLTSALDAIGFSSSCVASTTSNEPALGQDGVNAVWAIANALGERGVTSPDELAVFVHRWLLWGCAACCMRGGTRALTFAA